MENFTPELALDLAKGLLNKKEREDVEASFSSLKATNDQEIEALEKLVINKFQENDKFATYQVFTLDKAIDVSEVSSQANLISNVHGFIKKPKMSEWYLIKTHSDSSLVQFCFIKHKIIEVNEDFKNDAGEVEKVKTKKNAVLIFEANYQKTENRTIVLLKFPRFREEPHRLYGFEEEIKFFNSWNSDFIKRSLVVTDLKTFFEKLDHQSFDKYGFEVSDVKNKDSGSVLGSDFKIQFPFNSESLSTQMYKEIDRVIMPEFIQSFSNEFSSFLDATSDEKEDSAKITKYFSDFFEANGISEEFFSLLHQACEYGLGHVRFVLDGDAQYRYNLEYKQSKYGLIRVSHNGVNAFEPIFKELRKFLDQ